MRTLWASVIGLAVLAPTPVLLSPTAGVAVGVVVMVASVVLFSVGAYRRRGLQVRNVVFGGVPGIAFAAMFVAMWTTSVAAS